MELFHAPLNGETRHLISARELSRMKEQAVLVNTARGPIVDQPALMEALRSDHIAMSSVISGFSNCKRYNLA